MTTYLGRPMRRSKLERQMDIMKNISEFGPIRGTHVMYKSNITWSELKEDIQVLKALSLVEEVHAEEGLFYTITPAGREILMHFAQVEQALRSRA